MNTEPRQDASTSRNLVSLFEWRARKCAGAAAMKHKRNGRWEDVPWRDLARRARDVADGRAALGLRPGDRVAVVGDTNIEWLLADLGILVAGGVTVTIYQSSLPFDCQHILEDSGARFVFCDSAAQVNKIRAVRTKLAALEGVIRAQGAAADGFERTLAEVERMGTTYRASHPEAHEDRLASVGPDDVATIIYTSGTTGKPKGVVLTHGNWLYEAHAVGEINLIEPGDLVLMFLPMAHSFAKALEAAWFATGATAALVESLDRLMEDAAEVHPTVMPAVPRVFEKVFNTVVSTGFATPGPRGKVFRLAMESFEKYAAAREQERSYSSFGMLVARHLVFPKLARILAARFGGRMRLFVSGGAPLSFRIACFFELLGFTILEGYGLTETSAATFVNRPGQNLIGTVGLPMPGTAVRIAEDGEILVKGAGVMKGYHNHPASTAEVLQGGWLATGDVGQLDAAGRLRITDRKKDIIVTAGGKNVAPQILENELMGDPLISQVLVHGDRRRFVSALITLDEQRAREWAAEHGLASGEGVHLHPGLRARIQQTVDALNARTAGHSSIKKFAILARDFSQETGELTPTLKVKRRVITQKYQDLLDSFYVEPAPGEAPRPEVPGRPGR